jgi:hypothetical protein
MRVPQLKARFGFPTNHYPKKTNIGRRSRSA